MSGFLDRLNAMVVKTASPTGVVKARFNRDEGVRIEWGGRDPNALRKLSERELSEEIRRAVEAALEGAERGSLQARVAARKESGQDPDHDDHRPATLERRRLVAERIDQIQVTGSDTRDLITIRWSGRHRLVVEIAPYSLPRLSPEAVLNAVNQALATTKQRHDEAVTQAYSDVYQFGRLASQWRQRI